MSVEQYDPVANPYAPGAGTPPPTLVGRDALIESAEISLRRLIAKRSTQHLMLTGLRGVGKTVLLGTLSAVAEHVGFRVIRHEAVGGDDTVASLLRQSRRILDDLEPGPRVARAFRSIDSVSLTIAGTGVKLDKARRGADREALADVIADLATAAGRRASASCSPSTRRTWSTTTICAGSWRASTGAVRTAFRCGACSPACPNLVGEIAKAATYAERMFTVGDLGPLSPSQVVDAVRIPAEMIGVTWSDAATEEIVDRSDGFPFFVQIWAYHTWNAATDDPISLDDVRRAAPAVDHTLDASFFAARIARIPSSEVAYVQALASLGPGPHRSGDVATAAGKSTPAVAAFRERLITRGGDLRAAVRLGGVRDPPFRRVRATGAAARRMNGG